MTSNFKTVNDKSFLKTQRSNFGRVVSPHRKIMIDVQGQEIAVNLNCKDFTVKIDCWWWRRFTKSVPGCRFYSQSRSKSVSKWEGNDSWSSIFHLFLSLCCILEVVRYSLGFIIFPYDRRGRGTFIGIYCDGDMHFWMSFVTKRWYRCICVFFSRLGLKLGSD